MNTQLGLFDRRLLLLSLLFLVVACSSTDDQEAAPGQLGFEVVDSLLGPVYEVESARKSFHPPAGFISIPDSLFAALREEFTQQVSPEGKIHFVQFFFDQQHSAGLIVSTVRGLNLLTDTAAFVTRYRQAIASEYGDGLVTDGDYWVDSIYVKNFVITDSAQVRFHLLCLTLEGDALELQFVVPRPVYAELVKSLESSIGSLKPIQQGG